MFGFLDGVIGGDFGFDFGVIAWEVFDLVEINHSSLAHVKILPTTRNFGERLKAELKNDSDGAFVIFDRSFLEDIDAGIFDMAAQN